MLPSTKRKYLDLTDMCFWEYVPRDVGPVSSVHKGTFIYESKIKSLGKETVEEPEIDEINDWH